MKILNRGIVAALLAGAALVASPGFAKDKEPKPAAAPAPPKLSKGVAVVLQAVQKLQQAGDNPGALAKLAEADAVPGPTADDTYMINALRLNSAIATKDDALTEKSLNAMLATGKVPPDNTAKFLRVVGSLAMQRKDYNAATVAFQKLVAMNPADTDAQVGLAELFFAQKQNAKAVESLTQAIAASKAAGQPVPEAWYRRRLAIAYDGKQAAQLQPSALGLIEAYPNAVNWRDVLIITRDSYPSLDDQTELDFLRLQSATGSLNGERDYVEYADTALTRGYPGEAKAAVDDGIRRNMLVASKPLVAELRKTADSKVAADKAGLPGLEKDIKANPKIALVTGDAYYGYGDYAKAAALYRQAIGAANVDQATANLRLGMALAKSGDKAGATKALQAVSGGPREALAKYWLVYLNQTAA
ncbi:MAG: tetratricopeptide repeat protein [Sandarakinorhabdus sp.]|nr:tetratricopeptide repeat protein [Sandarakinorhabdus sp.]